MMKNCTYYYDEKNLNLHHLEGDLWTHTVMAYENTIKYNSSIYVKWAVVLHDLGRIVTRAEDLENKSIYFGYFEGASIYMSINILNKTDLSIDEKNIILTILSYQYNGIDYIKHNNPSIDELTDKFKYQENILKELSHYVHCDLLGRKIDESRIHLYDIDKMEQFIKLTENIQVTKHAVNNKTNILNILVGPPCSRKSSWVEKHNDNAIVISRDSCVQEIGKKYNKHNYDDSYDLTYNNEDIKKEVDNLEKHKEDIAKNSINKNIIIDNPNLKYKNRKEWIDMFKDTHTVVVTIFLPSFDDIIICTQKRSEKINKTVTKQIILEKLEYFSYPLLSEGIEHINYEYS